MIFHLAIPSHDLNEGRKFYELLGCTIGRKSDTFVIVNFNEHQIVLHRVNEKPPEPEMYPRHFGMIIEDEKEFNECYRSIPNRDWVWQECFHRYMGRPEEHKTFFLKDPSNNLIELKWYKNPEMVFGL